MPDYFKKQNLLASARNKKPEYFISVKSKRGTKLDVADPKITRLALALMDMQAGLNGAASHWGGPSAFADIISALYALIFNLAHQKNQEWYKLFHLINDAGHCENGLYAIKANYHMAGKNFSDLKEFRSIKSCLTGHGEAHLFPQGVFLSNGPLGSTLAQAQGLCMADSLLNIERSTLVLMSDGACMEGEAKEAFTSIPGFFKKNKMNPFIVIVSDNNTKLSGRIDKDSFSLDPFFKSLKILGWECIDLPLANDLQSCIDIFEELFLRSFVNLTHKPILIRAKTIKGYGVKQTALADHGGHGFPLKNTEKLFDFLEEIYGSKNLPEEFKNWAQTLIKKEEVKTKNQKSEKVQIGIGRAMIACRNQGLPVISVSSDLQGSTGVLPFRKKFPQYSVDVGVAEANMISLATGFSKQGLIPIVDTFAQFGVSKGALPLFMANLSQAPVIAIFSHAGFQDAADGASHQSLSYLAQTCSLPCTKVYCLSSSEEAFYLITQAIESFGVAYQQGKIPQSYIFFLGRENFLPSYLPSGYSYKIGESQIVYSALENTGRRAITLWASGSLLDQTLQAAKILVEKKWKVIVVNASSINQVDKKTLLSCLKKTDFRLLTIEDHHLIGGMGSLVCHVLALDGIKTDMYSLAVQSDFGRSAYQSIDLYKQEKLSALDIVEVVLSKFPSLVL